MTTRRLIYSCRDPWRARCGSTFVLQTPQELSPTLQELLPCSICVKPKVDTGTVGWPGGPTGTDTISDSQTCWINLLENMGRTTPLPRVFTVRIVSATMLSGVTGPSGFNPGSAVLVRYSGTGMAYSTDLWDGSKTFDWPFDITPCVTPTEPTRDVRFRLLCCSDTLLVMGSGFGFGGDFVSPTRNTHCLDGSGALWTEPTITDPDNWSFTFTTRFRCASLPQDIVDVEWELGET
jgi:hypothetical protein